MIFLAFLSLLCLVRAAIPANRPYFIRSQDGTPLDEFRLWIQTLDGGVGSLIPEDNVNHQTYLTNLTVLQADYVRKKDFILFVSSTELSWKEINLDDSSLKALNQSLRHVKRAGSRPMPNQLQGHPPMQWKFFNHRGLGSPPDGPREFRTDSGGNGVNLFVIDSGFNIDLDELSPTAIYYPPNSLFPPVVDGGILQPENIKEFFEHGTSVAIAAAGKTLGIAPNVNLFLAKWEVQYKTPEGTWWGAKNTDSMSAVLNWVTDKMDEQWEKGLQKNVVLFSSGVNAASNEAQYDRLFKSFIHRLDGYESLLITSAGNDGWSGKSLSAVYPRRLARPDNNVVIVGGVHMDGTLDDETTPSKDSGIEVDVWAPSRGVDPMFTDGHIETDDDYAGTSTAAALTAGAAAWYLGLDECEAENLEIDLEDLYDSDGLPKVMEFKKLITKKTSHQRSSRIIGTDQPIPTYALPSKLNAIYSMAQGPPPLG